MWWSEPGELGWVPAVTGKEKESITGNTIHSHTHALQQFSASNQPDVHVFIQTPQRGPEPATELEITQYEASMITTTARACRSNSSSQCVYVCVCLSPYKNADIKIVYKYELLFIISNNVLWHFTQTPEHNTWLSFIC